MEEAIGELDIAAQSEAADPRFALAYALALDGQGDSEAAVQYLEEALGRFGDDPALLATLANIYQRTGNEEGARALAERLPRR